LQTCYLDKEKYKEYQIMKLRLFNILACFGALGTLCVQPAPVEAIFASVKSTGMAAACISYPLDTLVGAYNPAGETDIGDRFDSELGWVNDRGSIDVSGNLFPIPPDAPVPPVNGHANGMRTKNAFPAGFGLNKNWCLSNDLELATGLIFYNRNYQKTTYKQILTLFGTSHAGLEYVNQTLSPIIALKWCQHSIGVSANYQIERLKVNGLQNFDHPAVVGVPGGTIDVGHVTNRGYDYSTGWGVTVGYLGHLTDCLSVGVTYQPETSMSRMNKYKGFLAQRGKLNIPRKIGAGISYRILPALVVAFDVEHIHWKPVKALSNPLLHQGDLELLGSSDGPGFGFRDQWYYRVGADWQINECWSVRAGFRHANTPIRPSQTAVNVLTLDTVENFATVGASWNVSESNELSIVYAYGFEKKIHGKNAIPVELGGGNVSLKEEKYALALAWGYKY
jgi:long-chain fatty acid transport protein